MFASYAKIIFPTVDYWRALACHATRILSNGRPSGTMRSPRKRRNVSHILGLSCDSGQTGPKRTVDSRVGLN